MIPIKKKLFRWYYHRYLTKRTHLIEIMRSYSQYAYFTPIKNTSYQERILYRVNVRTRSVGTLLDMIDLICKAMEHEETSITMQSINMRLTDRTIVRLDRYLIDLSGERYLETTTVQDLQAALSRLIHTLNHLQVVDPSVYQWYLMEFKSIYIDAIVVLDALLALNLGVTDGQRHWQRIESR